MFGITDITLLHPLITVSHFLEAVKKASKKTTPISLETNETETLPFSGKRTNSYALTLSTLGISGDPQLMLFWLRKNYYGLSSHVSLFEAFSLVVFTQSQPFFFCPKISVYNSVPLNMASERIPVDEVRRQDNPDEVYWSFKPGLDT